MKVSLILVLGAIPFGALAEMVDYKADVLPIMKERCWDCHSNETEVKGNLALDDLEEVRDYQVGKYNIIRPGNPDESNFLERLLLDSGHTDFMPRKAQPLPKKEIETITNWIRLGAVIDAENPTEEEAEAMNEFAGGSGMKTGEEDAFQSWKNSAGKEIKARFLALNEDKVQLLLENGKQYDVPLGSLSEASAEQARMLAEQ
ncbi:MAG: hypothetical protein P1U87_20945 [Verrucomicrobiales bacterium]|nr:hypothetical protein [Verrucomicrobiales bacterium]